MCTGERIRKANRTINFTGTTEPDVSRGSASSIKLLYGKHTRGGDHPRLYEIVHGQRVSALHASPLSFSEFHEYTTAACESFLPRIR